MLILFSDTTIIQRKNKITHVSISDSEIELLLKGYQLHPCSWDCILNYVTERCENLPDEALKYYKVATKKQLKFRLSVKLGKLQQTPLSSIANARLVIGTSRTVGSAKKFVRGVHEDASQGMYMSKIEICYSNIANQRMLCCGECFHDYKHV
jgi:hypothetical protein